MTPATLPAADSARELHNLAVDPEERDNLSAGSPGMPSETRTVLEAKREAKRLLPSNGAPRH